MARYLYAVAPDGSVLHRRTDRDYRYAVLAKSSREGSKWTAEHFHAGTDGALKSSGRLQGFGYRTAIVEVTDQKPAAAQAKADRVSAHFAKATETAEIVPTGPSILTQPAAVTTSSWEVVIAEGFDSKAIAEGFETREAAETEISRGRFDYAIVGKPASCLYAREVEVVPAVAPAVWDDRKLAASASTHSQEEADALETTIGFDGKPLGELVRGDQLRHHGLSNDSVVIFEEWTGEVALPRRGGAVLRYSLPTSGWTDTAVASEVSRFDPPSGGSEYVWTPVAPTDDAPNPVVSTAPSPDGGTIRRYKNGMVDAIDGPTYSLSPGFFSLEDLFVFLAGEVAVKVAASFGEIPAGAEPAPEFRGYCAACMQEDHDACTGDCPCCDGLDGDETTERDAIADTLAALDMYAGSFGSENTTIQEVREDEGGRIFVHVSNGAVYEIRVRYFEFKPEGA